MYIAHIAEDGRIQTCTEHSRNTAQHAKNALASVGLGSTAYLAGLLHDCGKFTDEFDNYIQKAVKGEASKGSVIHSFAGGYWLLKQFHVHKDESLGFRELAAELIAAAVYCHHGLIDIVDQVGKSGFEHRLTKQASYEAKAIQSFVQECADKDEIRGLFDTSVQEIQNFLFKLQGCDVDEQGFYFGFLARMLTSAVVEGDRSDTAAFMQRSTAEASMPEVNWSECVRSLECLLSRFPAETEIQKARKIFSEECKQAAAFDTGIYRLDLPTGGGKTLCSLRFAVHHAKVQQKKRIIYAAPLLSIVEQNAAVIRQALPDDSWMLEHHSNVSREETSSEYLARTEMMQDSWNAPVIVTTTVRLLEILFSSHMSDVRRLQALNDSVIIIDEVQSIPAKMLSMFNCAINFLSKACRTTVILCSATQPPFHKVEHKMLMSEKKIISTSTVAAYSPLFKRTDIHFAGSLSGSQIPDYIRELMRKDSKSLLVVCNTKNEAADLYGALSQDISSIYHLSAAMCMHHRKKILSEVQQKLENRVPVVLISTQVIEAGIDISFESVVRFSAGLDSIVQCAGRCNRNRESEEPGNVRIIRSTDEKLGSLHDIISQQDALNDLLAQYIKKPENFEFELASDRAVEYYYSSLYRAMKEGDRDYPALRTSLFSMLSNNDAFVSVCNAQGRYILNQSFKTAAENFSVFDEDSESVIVPYGEGKSIIEALSGDRAKYDFVYCRKLMQDAKEYTVSVPKNTLEKLYKAGVVITVLDGSVFAALPCAYNDATGLLSEKRIKENSEQCGILIL